jgi:hypothetical protein
MTRFAVLSILAFVAGSVSAGEPPGDEKGFTPLFDGRSLLGWEGNREAFRIQDSSIVGGSLSGAVPANEYLCTKKEYADFELRLKVRVRGDDPNAGIQIRSQRVPDSTEMVGYQADVGQVYWGCLYCERRHRLLAGPQAEDQGKVAKKQGWNDYVIRCQGRRIDLWLNGHHTVSYTEPDHSIPQEGVIGLQIHRGPPAESWYKDVRIKVFK